MNGMGAKHFFHPDNVVPAVEFVAAVVKMTCQDIAQVLMEIQAVIGNIRIILIAEYSNAGIDV